MERPILFSGPMVRTILAGRKTVTRRIMNPQPTGTAGKVWPDEDRWQWPSALARTMVDINEARSLSPFGSPGDRLWVRETVRRCPTSPAGDGWPVAVFAADDTQTAIDTWPWQRDVLPSIHMPRGVSRLTLEVTAVRVERLQEITGDDAKAEGAPVLPDDPLAGAGNMVALSWFRDLWDDINGDRASWASNPWVWRVEFRRVQS